MCYIPSTQSDQGSPKNRNRSWTGANRGCPEEENYSNKKIQKNDKYLFVFLSPLYPPNFQQLAVQTSQIEVIFTSLKFWIFCYDCSLFVFKPFQTLVSTKYSQQFHSLLVHHIKEQTKQTNKKITTTKFLTTYKTKNFTVLQKTS